MEYQQYIDDMQSIQVKILDFLEDESNDEENLNNLDNIFADQKITEHRGKFKSLLYLISNIGNNHYRTHEFFSKIEKILLLFQENIKKYCTNLEIFNIFRNNMRLLLFLIEKNILIFDKCIANECGNSKLYLKYFMPEAKKFPSVIHNSKELVIIPFSFDDDFFKLRKIGENDTEICNIIRNDKIEEFIIYISRNNISINATIQGSIYETNQFLQNKEITLIYYAAFFGSIQIFNYLLRNNAAVEPSIWHYAIHGKNAEIIHELKNNNIIPDYTLYLSCLIESIKCHHNDIANYLLTNFLVNVDDILKKIFNKILKYYNFSFMKNEFFNETSLYRLCKNNYIALVELFLKTKDVDINERHKNMTLL